MAAVWSANEWDYKRFSRLYELQNLQNRIGLGRNKSERRRWVCGTPVALHWKRGLLQRRMMGSPNRVDEQTTNNLLMASVLFPS